MAIQFACPWCTQTISVDDSKAHERIECPYCNLAVKVPTKSTPDLPPPLPLPSQDVEGPQPVGVGGSFHAMRQIVEFIFPKRIHRLSFLFRSLAVNLCFWLILASSSPFAPVIADTADWVRHYPYSTVAILALALYQLLFVLAPRARDTGISGWWVLFSLFPVVYFFLGIILIFRAPEYHFEGSSNAAEQGLTNR